jgi:sugar transferase (PEP-CTERM/EpsH1 system associated)
MSAAPTPPLIVHVVNALRPGGLENGVINLINGLPPDLFRHAVVCLTDYDDFARRIENTAVPVIALHKRPGKDPSWYLRMWRTLRSLRPAIVHTRNLATIEAQAVAFLAGVPGRIHGEHGWDTYDLRGANRKYRTLRKLLAPFIQRFVPLSMELESYLVDAVGIPPGKLRRICNGVDTQRFHPRGDERSVLPGQAPGDIVLGSIGRMEPVKDPLNLVDAFILAADTHAAFRERARLAIVGDGSLRDRALQRLRDAGLADRSWLPGHRDDVAQLLRGFDLFVLPSKAEGISNTILEAMASGLPVVATRVGGNSELLREGTNAALVPAEDSATLAEALWSYVSAPEKCAQHGRQSRIIAESQFSIDRMLQDYRDLYLKVLQP